MVITSTVATSSAMFKIAAKAAKALSGNKNMAESFTGAIANIGKVFKKGSEGSKGNAISKKIHQIGKRNLDKTMKVVKMIPQILKIVVAVLLVMAIANLAMALSSFLGFLTSLTNYNLTFPYESLDDRNLDTEVVAYDILYETFYDTISETSYYQVFNTTFTVGIQGQEEDLGLIGNLLRGWRVKDVSSTGAGVPGRTNSVFDMYVVAYDSIASVLNSVKNDGMDIRMTVHDANMRPIYGLQKALSYSDSYDRSITEASNELSLFRDYYGRENEFAISSGLLKELNDKVLNNPVGNAGENSIAYPEAFTKPVQFSYDYFRTRPYFTGDRDDDGNDINKWEDYTYITRRVLYEDIRDNAKISVSKEVMDEESISGVYTDFIDGEMTAEEIFNNKAKKNDEIGDNLITLASSLFSEIFTDTSKIENKYDMEGFIVSAASPYLYENIVLERNTRQDMQNVAGEKKYDYLAMNNVSKYATIKRYNQYSEYPEERQVRLYWRQVKKEGNNVTTTSKTSSVFDVTRDFLFTKKGENGKVFGIADGTVAGDDYVQGSNAFYGEKDGVFEFNSTSIKETRGTEYYLDGPYASIEDMLAGQKIPVYDMSNGALPDNWWNNSSYNQYSRPLETYSAKDESIDFGTGDTKGKVNARIMVVKAGDGDDAVYGYQIGYDQWPIIKTEEKIDNNPDASATSQPSTEPSSIIDLIDDTPKYYTWSTWDDNTKAKGTQMLTECVLTFPEKHYQLAQLETDQDGLVATGRVNFNTGEFQRVAVKDSYRRSIKYQSDLRDYIANMMSNENAIKTIEDKCYGNSRGSFVMLGRKMQAFFSNMGSLINESLRRSDIDHQIDQLELASDYIRNGKPEININTGSLVELNAAHIVSSYNGKTYSKDGNQFSYITGEAVSVNNESDDLKYDAILESKNKSNEVRNNICSTISTIIGCLQDEKEQDVNYAEIEMGEKEAAYLIYLFETRAVIPNGKIGQELEYSGSFRNYTDTTGLSSSIYQVLETWYSQEYEVGFNAAIVDYLCDNGIVSYDSSDNQSKYNNSIDWLENNNVYYNKHAEDSDQKTPSNNFSSTINPFPGTWYTYTETEYTPLIFRIGEGAVALYNTFFGGDKEDGEAEEEGEEEDLGDWINDANYQGYSLTISSGVSGNKLKVGIPAMWSENNPGNGTQIYRKEKRLPSPYDIINDVGYALTGLKVNTKLETTLLAEYVSSGYLPTSISYSYGKTPSGETARSMISDENSEAGKGLSGWWNSLKENRSVSAGNGSMIAMIGAGEDTSWGYDVAGNLHIGETQLVNIFETDEGINLLKYYTGLDISLWNKNRLAQRFLNTMTTNSNKQYSNDKISSSTVKVTNPNGDGMIEMTLQEKPMLRMDYEYRIRDSILDMDAWRVRSFSQGYDILPYETRSVRDYGLASILEYIEGVSVQFKRGLYYDERYSDYAVNAFVYWLKNSDLNGLVDTSKYQYDDTNTSNPYIYDELERGFYPAEYFTIGADSSNPEVSTNLLRDKFILGDATEMGEEAGRGGGAISSASDAFTQAMRPDGAVTEPPEINNTYTYEGGNIQSPANATDMNGLNNGWATLTFVDKSGNEHSGAYFVMDVNSSNGVTDAGEEITVYYYDVVENGKTDADIIYLKRIETETKFTQIDKRETGQTTITGSFLDESVSMPTSGEVVNADSLLLDYYDYLRNKSDVVQPVAPKIYFNCFVPYMSDKRAETYKEPNKYYISWLQRAIDLDKSDDRYQDLNTLSTALKLQASRTFVLNSDLVKEDALASKIKAYFKGVPGDRPQENLPLSFLSNLTLPDGASGGRYVFNNLYKNIDLRIFGFINLTVDIRNEAQDNGVIKINDSSFSLGETLDTAIAKYWLDGAGTETLSKDDYSRQIGEYTYIDDASVESMFLISQAVTFLGRFEYTYKDTVESISALSDYDSQRLIGLYYYDRYVELNSSPNYYGIDWTYYTYEYDNGDTGPSGEDDVANYMNANRDVKSLQSRVEKDSNLYNYLVDNGGNTNYLYKQITTGNWSARKTEVDELVKYQGFVIDAYSVVASYDCTCKWDVEHPAEKDKDGKVTSEAWTEHCEESHCSHHYVQVSYKVPNVKKLELSHKTAVVDTLGINGLYKNGNAFGILKNNPLRIYDDMIVTNDEYGTVDYATSVVTVDSFIDASKNDKWNMYLVKDGHAVIKDSVTLITDTDNAKDSENDYTTTWFDNGYYLMPGKITKNPNTTLSKVGTNNSFSGSVSHCDEHSREGSPDSIARFERPDNGQHRYEQPYPILMLCCGTDGAVKGSGTDSRTVGKTGPLNRNYIGSNWKIYLKEMDFYCDGETVKSWGDRLIFNDDENAMVNPAYYDFGKDVKLEKDRKTKYFESYLKYFETYIPSRVKTDSDLQERVDLVQNMADLMANGNLVITKELTPMFLNEVSKSYWDPVFKAFDKVFAKVELGKLTNLQKRKAFAQIIQGIFEVKFMDSVETNMLACGINSKSSLWTDSNKYETAAETMKDIMIKSCSFSSAKSINDFNEAAKRLIENNMGRDLDNWGCFKEMYANPYKYFLKNGLALGFGSFRVQTTNSSGQIEIVLNKPSNSSSLGGAGGRGFAFGYENWYDDIDSLEDTVLITLDSDKAADGRFVATEVLPFIADQFIINLNQNIDINQTIYETLYGKEFFTNIKSSNADLSKNDGYNGHKYGFSGTGSFAAGYYPSGYAKEEEDANKRNELPNASGIDKVYAFVKDRLVRKQFASINVAHDNTQAGNIEEASDRDYALKVFAAFTKKLGWDPDVAKGAMSYMAHEGSGRGTFTYEAYWCVAGPDGNENSTYLCNQDWLDWLYSKDTHAKYVAVTPSQYSSAKSATGLGLLQCSDVWKPSSTDGKIGTEASNATRLIANAMAYGEATTGDINAVPWQDPGFQMWYIIADRFYNFKQNPDYKTTITVGSSKSSTKYDIEVVNWSKLLADQENLDWKSYFDMASFDGKVTDPTNPGAIENPNGGTRAQEYADMVLCGIGMPGWTFTSVKKDYRDSWEKHRVEAADGGIVHKLYDEADESLVDDIVHIKGAMGVSARNNLASQLLKMELKDYRAFTSTTLELVTRHIAISDIENIIRQTPNYKSNHDKSVSEASFDEIFGNDNEFNILDLLGTSNSEGLYRRKASGSYEYAFQGTYDGICLGDVAWNTADWEGNEAIVYVALREAANTNAEDKNGEKYWKAFPFNGWVHWCACFAQWCASRVHINDDSGIVGEQMIPYTAGCISWKNNTDKYGGEVVPYNQNVNPAPGSFVLFQRGTCDSGHVGIIVGSDDKYIYTIEGNTTPYGGKWTQGIGGYQAVRLKQYSRAKNDISYYVNPHYERYTDKLLTIDDLMSSTEDGIGIQDWAGDGSKISFAEYFAQKEAEMSG